MTAPDADSAMRVTFVYPEYEALGIQYVSAALRAAGHETSLVFDPRLFADSAVTVPRLARLFARREALVEQLVESRPEVVAFSVLTHNVSWFLDLAGEAKRRLGVPVIAGGVHPTLSPAQVVAEPVVDHVVVGEGEEAAVDLVGALARGADTTSIPNVWTTRDGEIVENAPRLLIRDLDALPFPDKGLYARTPMEPRELYLAIASRGCAYRCTFCTENALQELYVGKGPYLRTRSPGDLLDELREARERIPYRVVWFCDEIFTWNLRWLREFCPRYREEIGVPFLALVHPNFVDDEVADLLALAGCAKVDMGVQTLTEDLRRDVLGRNETTGRVAGAIASLRRAGIWVDVDNIINLPGETNEDLVRMAAFYDEHRPDAAKFYWLQIYPGTEMVEKAVERGALAPEEVDRIPEEAELGSYYRGDPDSPREKRQIYLWLLLLLFFPRPLNRLILRHRLWRWLPTPGVAVHFHHVVLSLVHHLVEWIRWRTGLDRGTGPPSGRCPGATSSSTGRRSGGWSDGGWAPRGAGSHPVSRRRDRRRPAPWRSHSSILRGGPFEGRGVGPTGKRATPGVAGQAEEDGDRGGREEGNEVRDDLAQVVTEDPVELARLLAGPGVEQGAHREPRPASEDVPEEPGEAEQAHDPELPGPEVGGVGGLGRDVRHEEACEVVVVEDQGGGAGAQLLEGRAPGQRRVDAEHRLVEALVGHPRQVAQGVHQVVPGLLRVPDHEGGGDLEADASGVGDGVEDGADLEPLVDPPHHRLGSGLGRDLEVDQPRIPGPAKEILAQALGADPGGDGPADRGRELAQSVDEAVEPADVGRQC